MQTRSAAIPKEMPSIIPVSNAIVAIKPVTIMQREMFSIVFGFMVSFNAASKGWHAVTVLFALPCYVLVFACLLL